MSELNKDVVDLVWGRPSSGGVSASIFRRWTQGNDAVSQYDDMNKSGFAEQERQIIAFAWSSSLTDRQIGS